MRGPVPDKWIALLLRPGKEILVAEQVPCKGFIVLIGPCLARPKGKKKINEIVQSTIVMTINQLNFTRTSNYDTDEEKKSEP
jgi:hypothetical protein